MPLIENISEDQAKLNMMLAAADGETLRQMLETLDSMQAGKAAQMTFSSDENVEEVLKTLTKAARLRDIKIKRDRYKNTEGSEVVAVYLVEGPSKPRKREAQN